MPKNHSITVEEANEMIQKFLDIQSQLMDPKIFNSLPQDVRDYFAERIISFVFYKDQLEAYFKNVDANAIRFYYGGHKDSRPTIVVCACQIDPYDEALVENRIAPPGPGQYPSTFVKLISTKFDIRLDNRPPTEKPYSQQ